MATRRTPGQGSLLVHKDRTGGETWYGKWSVDGRQVKRKIAPKRKQGTSDGLTRPQAEKRLRQMMEAHEPTVAADRRLNLKDAGELYVTHLEGLDRKSSTIDDYRMILRARLVPFFGDRSLARITPELIEQYVAAKRRAGRATNTIVKDLNLLHGVFKYGVRRKWVLSNPVEAVDRPKSGGASKDIRYLTNEEVDALRRAAPNDLLGPTDRVLYLAAAELGLRRGELVALRWRDVDWTAGVVRVRQSYTRGQFGTPKSRRSSRAVPMADRVAAELERHFQCSDWKGDDDLVFAHPATGNVYDPSKLCKRFKAALLRANVGQFREVVKPSGKVERRPLIRFHDLRHTFGTQIAAAGAPLRSLQEWMGHQNYATTEIYADYAPDPSQGRTWAQKAFGGPGGGTSGGTHLSEPESTERVADPLAEAESGGAHGIP